MTVGLPVLPTSLRSGTNTYLLLTSLKVRVIVVTGGGSFSVARVGPMLRLCRRRCCRGTHRRL
jgi:hypothetical protein